MRVTSRRSALWACLLCGLCHTICSAAPVERLDFREIVKAAKDKVFPAVVFIKCVRETHETGKKLAQEVSGSGVIVSGTGEVLTNWHVVDKALEIRCLLFDGRSMNATVVGTDKDTDLALLQLELPEGVEQVPYATIGDSASLDEGEFVMAMGAPWGLNRSVSIGIVSCTRRYLPEHSEYSLWLQTDAAISPGNSGGPLVNTAGDVVGINALVVMLGGDMGFAIPAETVALVVSRLRRFGSANWSWTGLRLQPLKDFNKNIYFKGSQGVIVAETDPQSPARQADIHPRDRILRINGEPVSALMEEDLPALRRSLGLLPKNEPVRIDLVRNGAALTATLIPRKKGEVEGEELDCPRWDLTAKAINQFDNADIFFYRPEGVFVFGVKYPGNAQNAGIESNDIILSVDGKEVKTLADVEAIHKETIGSIERRHRVVLMLLRNGLTRQVVLDFARDYDKE